MAVYPSSGPDIVRLWFSVGRAKYRREVRAGMPPGAPVLLRVYLLTAEANEKGAPAWDSKVSHEPTFLKHLEMASIFG